MIDNSSRWPHWLAGVETQKMSRLAVNNKEKMMPAMAEACGVLKRSRIKADSWFIHPPKNLRTPMASRFGPDSGSRHSNRNFLFDFKTVFNDTSRSFLFSL